MKIFICLISLMAFLRGSALNYYLPVGLDLRGILTLVILFGLLTRRESISFFLIFLRRGFLFFLAFFLISYMTSSIFMKEYSLVRKIPVLVGTMLLVYYCHGSLTYRKIILVSYIIGALILSADGIYAILTFKTMLAVRIIPRMIGLNYGDGIVINHNYYGFVALINSTILIVLLFNLQHKILKLLSIITLLLFIIVIIFSTSRSAILSFLLTIPMILFYYYKTGKFLGRHLFLILFIGFMMIIIVYQTMSILELDSLKYRLIRDPLRQLGMDIDIDYTNSNFYSTERKEGTSSITGRKNMYSLITKHYQKNPDSFFFGGKVYGLELSAHNMFFNIILDTGLVGLLCYLLFMMLLFKSFWEYKDKSNVIPYYMFSIIAIYIYCQGQNREFMYPITFALLGGYLREIEIITNKQRLTIGNKSY